MTQSNAINIEHMRNAAAHASQLLKSMAHEDRLLLLCQLSQKELCVSELEQSLDMKQPSLSQQLGILRRQNLVHNRKEGKHVYYRIADEKALNILQSLYQIFCLH